MACLEEHESNSSSVIVPLSHFSIWTGKNELASRGLVYCSHGNGRSVSRMAQYGCVSDKALFSPTDWDLVAHGKFHARKSNIGLSRHLFHVVRVQGKHQSVTHWGPVGNH